MPSRAKRGGAAGRRLGAASALALVAAVPALARAQSLQDALSAAYANNPQILAERAQLRATDENVPQALANWRPTVTLSGSAGLAHSSTTGGLGVLGVPTAGSAGAYTTDTRPTTASVTVTQPLYRGGRTEAQTAQALNLVRAERANLVNVEQTVFLTVVTDYVNLVEQQAVVDLNVNNEQVLRRQLEATQDRFRVGEVTRTDVAQAEASYAQAIASRQAAEGQLQVYRATYEHDVGQPPGKLEAPTTIPELPASRDEAISLASSGAPTVINAQYAQEAAEDNVRVVRGQLLPQVSLQGTAEHTTDQEIAGQRGDDEQIVAQVTMPLYEGGAVYSQSRAAQQTVAQRKSQVDLARRSAVQSAAQAWEALQATRATIKSQKEQIRANEIALEGVQQEAAVGSRTILDILNQEQTLFQARVNLVQSQHDEIVDEFTLAESVGRLTAKNLGLPVEYYDPDKNFQTVRDKWIGFGTAE